MKDLKDMCMIEKRHLQQLLAYAKPAMRECGLETAEWVSI